MRFSNHAKVYLESALLKMIHLDAGSVQSNNVAIAPELANKVEELERIVVELQRQIKVGGTAQPIDGNAGQPRKNASKSSQTFKIPAGRINEVLKSATKQDIKTIREEWAQMMQTMQKSHAALLEDTEPVAASDNAFVLKFKYEIHCLMASENVSLRSGLSEALSSRTGKAYEVVYVPEEGWLKVREEYIRNNNLGKPEVSNAETQGNSEEDEELSFVKEAEQENLEPIVTEAEKFFGKDFIEVHDD